MSVQTPFYKSILSVGVFTVVRTGISFLSTVFLSRLLLPSEFGTLALITVFSGFISNFKDSGISYLVIRNDYNDEHVGGLQNFSVIVGLVLASIMALLAYPIMIFYQTRDLLLAILGVSLILFLESLNTVPLAILQKEMKFIKIGIIQTSALIVSTVFIILFAYMGYSYWSLIFGQWILAGLIFLLTKSQVKWSPSVFTFKKTVFFFSETKKMIGNIASSRFLAYWSVNADNLLVGKFYGASDLGIYSRAYQLLNLQMNFIAGTFSYTLLPALKSITNKNDLVRRYNDIMNVLVLIIIPVMILLVFFSREIVNLLWGSGWAHVAQLSPYFGVMAIVFLPISTFGSMYIITYAESYLFRSSVLVSVLTVGFILGGILFSIELMVLSLSLGFVLFVSLVHFGFGAKAGFLDRTVILKHWIPRILLCALIIFSIFFEFDALKIGLVSLLIIHTILICGNQLLWGVQLIKSKLSR